MFVLQECSICFEDFDSDRHPHSIPCGHVFCEPCLESLVSTSPQCPNCRVSYASASIRKVICTLQDQEPSGANAAQEPEAETLMWQAIQSAIESPQDLKQRKSIVQNNPEEAMLAAGMPKATLTLMRFLVQVEEKNGSLKDKLNTSWAVEESLRDQISRLEAKLSLSGASSCASSDHFKALLADVHKLQSVVDIINKNTSEVVRQISAKSESSIPQARPTETLERKPSIPPPAPIPVPDPVSPPIIKKQPSRPGILRKSLPQGPSSSTVASPIESPTVSRAALGNGYPLPQEPTGPTHHRYPSTPTPTRQLMSPPMTPSVLPEPLDGASLFGQSRWKTAALPPYSVGQGTVPIEQISHSQSPPMSRHLSMSTVPTQHKAQMAHLSMPTPSILLNPANNFTQLRPSPTPTPTQPSSSHSVKSTPLPATPNPAPAPTPKPQPHSRTLTAIFDFSGTSSTELSLRNGQKLYLLPESDTNKEWIWCKDENGTTGYAPKAYVKVDGV